MNRRKFLAKGAMSGVAAAAVITSRSNTVAESFSPPAAFELDELTIADLQSAMAAGKFSAHSLAKKYLDRIDELDKHGPDVNSVIELNPDVLSIARALEEERKPRK